MLYWYLEALKKYADFKGRARRREYWFFVLGNFLIAVLCLAGMGAFPDSAIGTTFVLIYVVFALGVIIPNLAVTVRRLHDNDRTGWWIFISIIPLIGPLISLYFLVQDSQSGKNRFGLNPKGEGSYKDANAYGLE